MLHAFALPIDASQVIWITTANDARGIPEPILNRMNVFEIEAPSPEAARRIARQLYASIRGDHDWGRLLGETPSDDVLDHLATLAAQDAPRSWWPPSAMPDWRPRRIRVDDLRRPLWVAAIWFVNKAPVGSWHHVGLHRRPSTKPAGHRCADRNERLFPCRNLVGRVARLRRARWRARATCAPARGTNSGAARSLFHRRQIGLNAVAILGGVVGRLAQSLLRAIVRNGSAWRSRRARPSSHRSSRSSRSSSVRGLFPGGNAEQRRSSRCCGRADANLIAASAAGLVLHGRHGLLFKLLGMPSQRG
jgi:hypothetical protein